VSEHSSGEFIAKMRLRPVGPFRISIVIDLVRFDSGYAGKSLKVPKPVTFGSINLEGRSSAKF